LSSGMIQNAPKIVIYQKKPPIFLLICQHQQTHNRVSKVQNTFLIPIQIILHREGNLLLLYLDPPPSIQGDHWQGARSVRRSARSLLPATGKSSRDARRHAPMVFFFSLSLIFLISGGLVVCGLCVAH
jgi:hypothetical protein